MIAKAYISKCGQYRYLLERNWAENDAVWPILFVMLNPSTADAYKDDPTIRRCVSFAQSMRKNVLYVANLYAYRATSPTELKKVTDPIGPKNKRCLTKLVSLFPRVICAWGKAAEKEHAMWFYGLCNNNLCTMQCFGTNKDNSPRHPLYLPKTAELKEYSV